MDNAWSVFWYAMALAVFAGFCYAGWLAARMAYRFWRAKVAAQALATAVASGAYVLSPLDFIPDLALGLGWLDDWVVILLAILYLRKLWRQSKSEPNASVHVPASQATIEVTPEIQTR